MTDNPVRKALELGQSIWYDGLATRAEYETMISRDGLRGGTTNPTIFEKALASGTGAEAERLRTLVQSQGPDEAYKTLAIEAVREVADLFLPVYRQSGGRDGFVSLEVSPLLARDTAATIAEARELRRRVERDNVMIKVPATQQGIPAVETLISEGFHVNVTLIFSVERYREVMEAYLKGLERRYDAGRPVSHIASVASFFVSRVDTAVDALLAEAAAGRHAARAAELGALLGKIAVANSKAAYRAYEHTFGGERFKKLKTAGAAAQRPLWASTGTKNPAYSDVLYVETLIGPDTVNTMPPATYEAFRGHGKAASTLTQGVDEALAQMAALESYGIHLKDVTDSLEEAGVQLFADSFRKLMARIREAGK